MGIKFSKGDGHIEEENQLGGYAVVQKKQKQGG